ncbi:VOC family protein [Phenylobacterium sp.]|uniref:VOC family protein n=1 Tax=Phenylobacterium sp. TaxID=1871053 RepID=UPI002B536D0C|nr:VOC family protein [Phenylobacterium sp.]HVI34094.1 VOC family protein [Phenylobacterium sp.]
MSIGYVTIGAQDVEGAQPFFDATLGALGWKRSNPMEGWAFYGPEGQDAVIGVCRPYDGAPARAGNGIMVAFKADTKDQLEAAHAAALANGGSDEGPPGYRSADEVASGFYAAYFRDPVGNKFCVYLTD